MDNAFLKNPDRVEYAVDLFIQGYSCSECIVMAFADQFDLEPDMAVRISSGFGFAAGRGREKTCGAVTGAIMILGLKYGAGLKRDSYIKDRCVLVTQEFLNRFLALRKSVACQKIHLADSQGLINPEKIKTLTGKKAFCAHIAKDAATILREILDQDYS